jgi:hypothetical protein
MKYSRDLSLWAETFVHHAFIQSLVDKLALFFPCLSLPICDILKILKHLECLLQLIIGPKTISNFKLVGEAMTCII